MGVGPEVDTPTHPPQRRRRSPWWLRATGALLALEVTWVHVVDQGGPFLMRDHGYLGWGYRALEVAGVVVALWLGTGWWGRPSWLLACGVAGVPLIGYLVSGGAALPRYSADTGHLFGPLAVAAVAAEVVLLVLAGSALRRLRPPGGPDDEDLPG